MNSTTAPAEARTPSLTAAPLPRFSSLRMTWDPMRPAKAASAVRAASAVPSVLPSSTTTISEAKGFFER